MTNNSNYAVSINATNLIIVGLIADMAFYHGRKLIKSTNASNDYDFHQYQYGISLFLLIANLSAFIRGYALFYTQSIIVLNDFFNFATFVDRFAMLCAYSYLWFMGRKYRIEWFA